MIRRDLYLRLIREKIYGTKNMGQIVEAALDAVLPDEEDDADDRP